MVHIFEISLLYWPNFLALQYFLIQAFQREKWNQKNFKLSEFFFKQVLILTLKKPHKILL